MSKFWNLFVSGTVTGAIYSVMAAGLVLTYQTSGIFNFAHAAVAFATAYMYYQFHTGLGLPIVVALVLAVLVFAPLLGLALDRIMLRRLRTAPMYARIVATIGLLVALPNLVQWVVEAVLIHWLGVGLVDVSKLSADTGGVADVPGVAWSPPHTWRLGFLGLDDVTLTSDQVALFVAAAFAAVLLYVVIRRTRLGLEMRALVDRESLASLRGIHPARTSAVAWILTMILAGLAGVLIAPLFQLSNSSYQFVVLGSLAAVAVAGFRSIPLAFVAGLALGVIQNLVVGYRDTVLPGFVRELAGLTTSVPFVLTLVILLILSGRRTRAAGTVAEEKPMPDHRAGLPRWRRLLPWGIFVTALLVFTFGWIPVPLLQASDFEVNAYLAPGIAYGIIFLSFVVVTGLGGMISLAQATFVTAGGVATGWLLQEDLGLHLPLLGASNGRPNFVVACLFGAAVAALLGAVIALAVRRLGTLALALGTLALAFSLDFVVFRLNALSNFGLGWSIRGPTWDVFGIHTFRFDVTEDHGKQLVVLLLVLFGLITLMIHNVERGASGRAIFAVRSSEIAARTSGIAPGKSQVALFALSAGIAGFGGSFLGLTSFYITPTTAPPLLGLFWIALVVTWGVRRPGGALLAGLAATTFPYLLDQLAHLGFMPTAATDLLTSPYFTPILFGLAAINLAQNPDGVLALVGHKRLERRRERERLARIEAAERALGGPDESTRVSVTEARAVALAADASSTGAPPVLVLEHLAAGYGDVDVLHDVSLAVSPGEVVALLGPNGAGKSTLCNVAAGAIPLAGGHVFLDDVDVSATLPSERTRAGLILVPEARGIFPGLTVEENLRILLRNRDEREAAYARTPVLDARRKQLAGVLSGGEQQLLSLAPVLERPPRVLIADEPTLGLAPLAAEAVLDALLTIRERGTAVLLVEERATEVMKIADVVAIMDLGRIAWLGATRDASRELLASAYLGAPGTGSEADAPTALR